MAFAGLVPTPRADPGAASLQQRPLCCPGILPGHGALAGLLGWSGVSHETLLSQPAGARAGLCWPPTPGEQFWSQQGLEYMCLLGNGGNESWAEQHREKN